MDKWYTRPVMFVSDIEQSIDFYTGRLGFHEAWKYDQDGTVTVAQVNRGSCEIILATDPERAGGSRLFISLEQNEMESWRREIQSRSIPAGDAWWGYPVIRIEDPDGNELLFPLDESNS